MNRVLNILLVLCIVQLTIQPAHAYLDPGTGSMIVQILVASVATVLIFFKLIWQSIKGFFHKGSTDPKSEDD